MQVQKTSWLDRLGWCVRTLFGRTKPATKLAGAAIAPTPPSVESATVKVEIVGGDGDATLAATELIAALETPPSAAAPAIECEATVADLATAEPEAETGPVLIYASIEPDTVSAICADAPIEAISIVTASEAPRSVLAFRLASVNRINRTERKKKRRRKMSATRGSTPRPSLAQKQRATAKRAPALFPIKRKTAVAKKATLKVLTERPKVRVSATIIPWPVASVRRANKLGTVKLKKAA
jgi:hypothetical protein